MSVGRSFHKFHLLHCMHITNTHTHTSTAVDRVDRMYMLFIRLWWTDGRMEACEVVRSPALSFSPPPQPNLIHLYIESLTHSVDCRKGECSHTHVLPRAYPLTPHSHTCPCVCKYLSSIPRSLHPTFFGPKKREERRCPKERERERERKKERKKREENLSLFLSVPPRLASIAAAADFPHTHDKRASVIRRHKHTRRTHSHNNRTIIIAGSFMAGCKMRNAE